MCRSSVTGYDTLGITTVLQTRFSRDVSLLRFLREHMNLFEDIGENLRMTSFSVSQERGGYRYVFVPLA